MGENKRVVLVVWETGDVPVGEWRSMYRTFYTEVRPENVTARRLNVWFGQTGFGQRMWKFDLHGRLVNPADGEFMGSHLLMTPDCLYAIEALVEMLLLVWDVQPLRIMSVGEAKNHGHFYQGGIDG